MFSLRYILSVLVFSYGLISYAQKINLNNYEWKNRIVVIISEDYDSELYKSQLKEFKKDKEGFSERKLLVFDVKKGSYRKISYKSSSINIGSWEQSEKMFTQFFDKKAPFKVLLIGLDGRVKNVFINELLTKETLFTIIDGMFMRQQELNRKG